MEPPKFKVQGYLSFLLYLHNRVELCVKLYLYMSVYICQVSNIVCIPDLLLLRILYNWVLLQNISDGISYLYSDLSETVRSMIRPKAPGFNGMYSTDNIKHVKVGHSHLEERKSVKSGSKFNSTIIKPSTAGPVPVVRIFSVISVSEDVNKEN